MNLGWRRRTDRNQLGYWLDIDRGRWERAPDDDGAEDPAAPRRQKRIPYMFADTRNCLVIHTRASTSLLPLREMASLEAALKVAIQREYQLEDRELGTEPLPRSG